MRPTYQVTEHSVNMAHWHELTLREAAGHLVQEKYLASVEATRIRATTTKGNQKSGVFPIKSSYVSGLSITTFFILRFSNSLEK